MTATEVLQRRDERLRLLGPVVSRMQAEFQGPLIERSLRILERRSQPFWREGLDGPLPLPPPALGESELKVDYVTPIGQAQKAVQVESMARVIEGVERLSSFDRALPGLVRRRGDGARDRRHLQRPEWTCCGPPEAGGRRCASGRPRRPRRSRRRAWGLSRPER